MSRSISMETHCVAASKERRFATAAVAGCKRAPLGAFLTAAVANRRSLGLLVVALLFVPMASAVTTPATGDVTPKDVGFEEIVFVKRKPYSSDHYYTDINNGTAPDRFVAANGIYIYNLRTKTER
ncbi:MAG: hypothetical protein FJ388_22425, partial [Verrucomicrobia bacterium]|nr:hypothetical protein [Verrucomicrobiota bacterium]